MRLRRQMMLTVRALLLLRDFSPEIANGTPSMGTRSLTLKSWPAYHPVRSLKAIEEV